MGIDVCGDLLDSPIGPLGIAATDDGVVAITFAGDRRLAPRVARRLDVPVVDDPQRLAPVRGQLREYFAGTRHTFDLTLDWSLADGFTLKVLRTLQATVEFGATATYGQLAARAGQEEAAQAVGAAMGANPLPIVVPCHRVVASNGLGGFGGGLERKRWLLTHEGVLPPTLDWALQEV